MVINGENETASSNTRQNCSHSFCTFPKGKAKIIKKKHLFFPLLCIKRVNSTFGARVGNQSRRKTEFKSRKWKALNASSVEKNWPQIYMLLNMARFCKDWGGGKKPHVYVSGINLQHQPLHISASGWL